MKVPNKHLSIGDLRSAAARKSIDVVAPNDVEGVCVSLGKTINPTTFTQRTVHVFYSVLYNGRFMVTTLIIKLKATFGTSPRCFP